jgi:DNA-binding MarR family transcriptional regulator
MASPNCYQIRPRPTPQATFARAWGGPVARAAVFTSWHDGNVSSRNAHVSETELQRAAAFRSALRRFLGRTDEVANGAGLTSQRYDLLLSIKSASGGTSTTTELSRRLSLRQTAVTELVKRAEEAGLVERATSPEDGRVSVLALTDEGELRLMRAFVGLREERRQLAEAMSAVGASFRAFVDSQQEVAR